MRIAAAERPSRAAGGAQSSRPLAAVALGCRPSEAGLRRAECRHPCHAAITDCGLEAALAGLVGVDGGVQRACHADRRFSAAGQNAGNFARHVRRSCALPAVRPASAACELAAPHFTSLPRAHCRGRHMAFRGGRGGFSRGAPRGGSRGGRGGFGGGGFQSGPPDRVEGLLAARTGGARPSDPGQHDDCCADSWKGKIELWDGFADGAHVHCVLSDSSPPTPDPVQRRARSCTRARPTLCAARPTSRFRTSTRPSTSRTRRKLARLTTSLVPSTRGFGLEVGRRALTAPVFHRDAVRRRRGLVLQEGAEAVHRPAQAAAALPLSPAAPCVDPSLRIHISHASRRWRRVQACARRARRPGRLRSRWFQSGRATWCVHHPIAIASHAS